MPLLACPLEVKSLSSEGVFEGLASTFDLDEGGDQCVPGCFTETLKIGGPQRPMLADHRTCIGVVTLAETAKGLKCSGKFTLDVQAAREVYELMKDGAIRGLSIGYQVQGDKGAEVKNGIRYLKNLRLYEISTTPFPMNTAAMVQHVKSTQQQEQQIKTALADCLRAVRNF